MENTVIKDEEIYGKKSPYEKVGILREMAEKHNNCLVVIDVGGLGSGAVDPLIGMGANVLPIDNAGSTDDKHRFYNRRAEAWYTAGEMFAGGDVQFRSTDIYLRGQLCTPRYEFRNGKILIDSKDSIKKRLKKSPDRADAYVNGLYALQYVEGKLIGGRGTYSSGFDDDDIYVGGYSAMPL